MKTNNKKYIELGLTVIGIIIFVVSIVFLYSHSYHNNEKVKNFKHSVDTLSALSDTVLHHTDSMKQIIKEISIKNTIECYAEYTGQIDGNKRPIYNITMFLNDSMQNVLSVDYTFNHSSFFPKTKTSFLQKKKFVIEYRGYGCLDTVKVVIRFKDGKTTEIDYQMCKNLKFKAEKL